MKCNNKKRILTILLLIGCVFVFRTTYVSGQSKLNKIEIEDFSYSTFFGGNNVDYIKDVVIDSEGNVIVTGETLSTNFPVVNGFQETFAGGDQEIHTVSGDAIVSKFNQNGDLIWSTFLGGSNRDGGHCVLTDDSGNIYVAGMTNSIDFPITEDAYQQNFNGGGLDLFVTKFAPNGSLLYSSYLGTDGSEGVDDLKLDSSNNLIISGGTSSPDFPITTDACQSIFGGGSDGFILKLTPNCTSILYSTFIGGSDHDSLGKIAIDEEDNIFFDGTTSSSNFPITNNAFQDSISGTQRDIFLGKHTSTGQITYATFFGGSHMDDSFGLTIDSSKNIIFSGRTWSADFPVANAYQDEYSDVEVDAFVSKLSPDGQKLTFSSYFGASGWDTLHHVDVDSDDNIILSGVGGADGFPISNAFQEGHKGACDIVVMALSSIGQPLFCSFLGGTNNDHPFSQFLSDDYLYIVGYTTSTNFFTSDDAYQQTCGGNEDGFIFRLTIDAYLEEVKSRITTGSTDFLGFEYIFIVLAIFSFVLGKVKKKRR